MPIYDVAVSGTSTEIGKLFDVATSGTTTQIGAVYDHNGTTATLIYKAEATLFTGLTQQTAVASGTYTAEEKLSSTYTNDGFASLAVTGTVGGKVIAQGTYGYEGNVKIQGSTNNSTWTDLKTWNVGGNSDVTTSVNVSVNINGYTYIRVRCWIRTANIGAESATSGYTFTTNLQGIAS